jgi:hypothetical protein
MQSVNTIIRRPVPIRTAAASGLLAFVAGAVIAVGAPAVVTGLSVSHSSKASISAVPHEQAPDTQDRNAAYSRSLSPKFDNQSPDAEERNLTLSGR